MKAYQTKAKKIKGTDFREVRRKSFSIYQQIAKKTKRRPYVRSAYFGKDKIFLGLFWQHLFDKQKWQNRMRRLHYFEAGIELIRCSRINPQSKENPNKSNEILHRFFGLTADGCLFCVQIKENKRTGQKYLISIFPENQEKKVLR